jgi:hypothetical protein
METRDFLVQGSAQDPYKVTFRRDGSNLRAYCTCPAGENGMYCKHRFNILEGSNKGIVSPNGADVQVVASWLAGTEVEAAMRAVREIEKEEARVKSLLILAKKALARAMLG